MSATAAPRNLTVVHALGIGDPPLGDVLGDADHPHRGALVVASGLQSPARHRDRKPRYCIA